MGLTCQYKRQILILLVIQMGCAALYSVQPFFFQRIVSLVITEFSATLFLKGLGPIAALALTYVALTLLQGIGGAVACKFASDLLDQLQTAFFEQLNRLPLQEVQHQSAGEFMTKFNTDISQTQALISHLLPRVLRETVTILAVISILFYACPATLTFLAVFIVLMTAIFIVKLNRVLEKYARDQRSKWADINRVLDETVQGIDTLKLFAAENERNRYFSKKTASLRRLSVKSGTIVSIFSPVIDLISKFGGLLLVLAAYLMIVNNQIIIDDFLLFFFYVGLLEASVSALINALSNIQPQRVSVDNLCNFFNRMPEEVKDPDKSKSIDAALPINITGLGFAYPRSRMLYCHADLFIPAKAITVIHGPSGSGKSTLINLLLRFYTPGSGEIRLGKENICNFSPRELRKKISVVTQFHYIFHETLKQNLTIAAPWSSDQQVESILEKARLGELVRRLPGGIHEILDPRGKNISGGERQRICMARLLLKNTPILILDEPWSSLDESSKVLLIDIINQLKATATILILTHELPVALDADQVYQLKPNKGRFEVVNHD